MKEIKIKYSTVSPRRQELRDRLQLIGASISIIIGYSETLNIYAGITIILPIIGFVIAFINILFVRFYKNLVQKYGDQFELVLMRTNGIIMLITGIGFQIAGSKYIQYIDRIWIHKGVIKIKQKGHNKIKQFFFEATTEKQTTIYGFIENIKFEKGYGFEIQKIG